jgi:hypothetical protein
MDDLMVFDFEIDVRTIRGSISTKSQRQIDHAQPRTVMLDLLTVYAQKNLRRLNNGLSAVRAPTFRFTKFDQKLISHVQKHGGWNGEARQEWQVLGRQLESAGKRLQTLKEARMINSKGAFTSKGKNALEALERRDFLRLQGRSFIVQKNKKKTIADLTRSFSQGQRNALLHLATFRQMTPGQFKELKVGKRELAQLQTMNLIESRNFYFEGQKLSLMTLTKPSKPHHVSGSCIAKHGLGIKKPEVGFQKDQSKILHDVSVVDAVLRTTEKYEKRGFVLTGILSEHMAYGLKEASNSDQGKSYADAYLTFSKGGEETMTVAVEFGNYRPSYLKEKLVGLEADEIQVYTHDASRVSEYAAVVPKELGIPVEISNIPSPLANEVER